MIKQRCAIYTRKSTEEGYPIYIGKVRHKDILYDGLHEAIVDADTWQQVQNQLAGNGGQKMSGVHRSAKRLLDGRLFDEQGRAMGTTYASKRNDQTAHDTQSDIVTTHPRRLIQMTSTRFKGSPQANLNRQFKAPFGPSLRIKHGWQINSAIKALMQR